MEKSEFLQFQNVETVPVEKIMDDFYSCNVQEKSEDIIRISAEQIAGLKEKGIKLETFLEYICSKYNYLMHGSIVEIKDKHLRSQFGKIFAANKSAIAIMRSIYSNRNVNLEYPYQYDAEHPLKLVVHTPPDGKYISTENGFIYLVKNDGFQNDPVGSWQFVNNIDKVNYEIIVETKKSDFNHPTEFRNDNK